MVDLEEARPEIFWRAVQWRAKLFYADNGTHAYPRQSHLQEALDIITGISDRVGLWKNMKKE